MAFLNPYQFIPVEANVNGLPLANFEELQSGNVTESNQHLTHDRFVQQSGSRKYYSGRLTCNLRTVGPMFISKPSSAPAAQEDQDDAELLFPYTNGPGGNDPYEAEPAIPASSLRGLISSTAEALSNSTLRILDNRMYSVRSNQREPKHRRPMIGKVVEKEGRRWIRPLTLPATSSTENIGSDEFYPIDRSLRSIVDALVLPVYLDGYKSQGFLQQLLDDVSNNITSWSQIRTNFWELETVGLRRVRNRLSVPQGVFRRSSQRYQFIIGIHALRNGEIDCRPSPNMLPDGETGEDSTRGILRVLGVHTQDRSDNIPNTKKHELFIPVPDLEYFQTGFKVVDGTNRNLDLVADVAIEEFETLARQATARTPRDGDPLPYELAGQPRDGREVRNSQGQGINTIRLQDGYLVYFRIGEDVDERGLPEIDSVAIASLWREEAGRTFEDYFQKMNPNLVPFDVDRDFSGNESKTTRDRISLCEQIFGFIPEGQQGRADRNAGPNESRGLKGRVRFSDGVVDRDLTTASTESWYQPEVPLKILSTPKPPCPTMYFRSKNGHHISKSDLAGPTNQRDNVEPMGRKIYLHHPLERITSTDFANVPWKSHSRENLNQKKRIRPVRPGVSFRFQIEFDNLNQEELSLILWAIQPSSTFHHKLGMGKPLGLGTVKLGAVKLELIDRTRRYLYDDIFSNSKYHEIVLAESDTNHSKRSLKDYRKSFQPSRKIKKAMELTGRLPRTSTTKIHYPLTRKQLSSNAGPSAYESKHFEWFGENEARQSLPPLDDQSQELPSLDP